MSSAHKNNFQVLHLNKHNITYIRMLRLTELHAEKPKNKFSKK